MVFAWYVLGGLYSPLVARANDREKPQGSVAETHPVRVGADLGSAGDIPVRSGPNLIRVIRVEESRNLPLQLLGHTSRWASFARQINVHRC